jgi:hypothetical protein
MPRKHQTCVLHAARNSVKTQKVKVPIFSSRKPAFQRKNYPGNTVSADVVPML